MHDIDARLGATVADLVRAGRVLDPDHLDGLLDNVAAEIAVALLEADGRRRAARVRARTSGNVVPLRGTRETGHPGPPPDCEEGA